jgi:hypothetical protein
VLPRIVAAARLLDLHGRLACLGESDYDASPAPYRAHQNLPANPPIPLRHGIDARRAQFDGVAPHIELS